MKKYKIKTHGVSNFFGCETANSLLKSGLGPQRSQSQNIYCKQDHVVFELVRRTMRTQVRDCGILE